MRVALINPRFRLPIDTRTTAHLGLAYLGAVSQKRGDTVRVFDCDVEEQSLEDFVQEFKPDLIGITANTPQVKQAWRTAKAIKEVHDAPIVLGGPHVSVAAEGLDYESVERPYVDMVVRGEGEGPWLEISNKVEDFLRSSEDTSTAALMDPNKHIWDEMLGITYKTSDGQVYRNMDAKVINDLDSLPWPAYNLFRMNKYTNLQPATDHVDGARSFSIMTSRGCPYRCTFCSQSIMPIKWRARTAENVIEEWRHLVHELGAEEIGVLDDSANIRRDRLMVLSDMLIANKLNHVPWIFVNGIRANLADKVLMAKLKEAGLLRTAFGVETGNPDMIKAIDKHVDHDTIRQAFKNCKEVGLQTIGFFIIGLPGDTRETMQDTIDFAIELDPLIANFSMMTPYPGTKVYEIVKREGKLLMDDWEDYVFFEQKARYEMGELTAELMTEMYRKAYRQFYLRPGPIMRRLRAKDFWMNLPRNIRIARRTFFKKPEKTELKRVIEAEGRTI
ncbi:MAG TPA: radical SAM protein [Anaerolineae bacterium]|nr:radical SAM protein [Anaerolineae bacterium]HNU04816.1 radical SAM protein [Anaerolineae bacterium]